jgi:hypothetical protein
MGKRMRPDYFLYCVHELRYSEADEDQIQAAQPLPQLFIIHYSLFIIHFIPKGATTMGWSYLAIILAVCAVLCAVGFYKFVYFLSIGYGFAVAGGGIAIFIMYLLNPSATPIWVVLVQMARCT